jgi:predicted kinase
LCERRTGHAVPVARRRASSYGEPVNAGSQATRLIVLRGNSGSGKSTAAAEIRARHGRGIALVSQDNLRRVVLREKDVPGGANIGLIDVVARYALDHGFHVILDGILYADRYAPMLDALRRNHRGMSRFYYLDVPFEETVRRHAARPQAPSSARTKWSAGTASATCCPAGSSRSSPRRGRWTTPSGT